jgi:hypothetical protein
MKQKIILLLVLIAGLTACTKDDDDIANNYVEMASPGISQYGEFEGDWILNNEKVDTAKLVVTEHSLIVREPSEPLIKYAAKNLLTIHRLILKSYITLVYLTKSMIIMGLICQIW